MMMNIAAHMASVMTAGLLVSLISQTDAVAADPTQIVAFTGMVVNKTCTFDDVTSTVVLDDIGTREFTDTAVKKLKDVPVSITCGAGVTSVKIVPSGTPDEQNDTLFSNTGDSTGVALRLQDLSGTTMLPSGSTNVSVIPSSGKGSYTFRVGYVATAPGTVTGGRFLSQVTLNFNYN
ncbi:fimbrial protein [Klebsiella indica]|uniref:Fimbrial protein n=1 Tax=Klebsiella indica TaxID=2582917 RepID=A0A5R9L8W8_9ENTR|nr:fimbrial protein [Klebsiella indica]TLV05904.1 fimbrial protein [Klebsiella indica]